jgi:hypothetical protein
MPDLGQRAAAIGARQVLGAARHQRDALRQRDEGGEERHRDRHPERQRRPPPEDQHQERRQRDQRHGLGDERHRHEGLDRSRASFDAIGEREGEGEARQPCPRR